MCLYVISQLKQIYVQLCKYRSVGNSIFLISVIYQRKVHFQVFQRNITFTHQIQTDSNSLHQCYQVKNNFKPNGPRKLVKEIPPNNYKMKHSKSCQRHTPTDKDGNAFQVHHAQSIYLMVSGLFEKKLQWSAT